MVLRISTETIEDLFSSKEFQNCFEETYKENKDLLDFLNNIETNKKYYKLGIHKNKRYRKNENNDTTNIKKINSLLNKITFDNYENICNEIIPLLKKPILSYILENIIEKSLLHHIYIELYVKFINTMKGKYDINIILNKEITNKYNNLLNEKIDGDSYEDLCKKNNNIDKLGGLTILISYLEKDNEINTNSKKIIDDLLSQINYDNLEEIYKIIGCLYNIFKINKEVVEEYSDKLNEIKNNKINSKIKFKIMDILDI